jgi:hypothetical protein
VVGGGRTDWCGAGPPHEATSVARTRARYETGHMTPCLSPDRRCRRTARDGLRGVDISRRRCRPEDSVLRIPVAGVARKAVDGCTGLGRIIVAGVDALHRAGDPDLRRGRWRFCGARHSGGSAPAGAGFAVAAAPNADGPCRFPDAHVRYGRRAIGASRSAWPARVDDDAGVASRAPIALRERCRHSRCVRARVRGRVPGELVRLVQREGLDVERVFSEHLPATPWAELVR